MKLTLVYLSLIIFVSGVQANEITQEVYESERQEILKITETIIHGEWQMLPSTKYIQFVPFEDVLPIVQKSAELELDLYKEGIIKFLLTICSDGQEQRENCAPRLEEPKFYEIFNDQEELLGYIYLGRILGVNNRSGIQDAYRVIVHRSGRNIIQGFFEVKVLSL